MSFTVAVLLALAGCESDEPEEPDQGIVTVEAPEPQPDYATCEEAQQAIARGCLDPRPYECVEEEGIAYEQCTMLIRDCVAASVDGELADDVFDSALYAFVACYDKDDAEACAMDECAQL